MADEDVILDLDAFADERMTRDLDAAAEEAARALRRAIIAARYGDDTPLDAAPIAAA